MTVTRREGKKQPPNHKQPEGAEEAIHRDKGTDERTGVGGGRMQGELADIFDLWRCPCIEWIACIWGIEVVLVAICSALNMVAELPLRGMDRL